MYKYFLHGPILKTSSFKRLLSLEAKISPCSEHLEIKTDNYEDKFPLVWLRDNCQCSKCHNKLTNSRTVDWNKFDLNVKADNIEPKKDNSINVQWSDKHTSTYNVNWLRERSFKKEIQDEYLQNIYQAPKIYWPKAGFFKALKRHDFERIMKNDLDLHNFLQDLIRYGITKVENVPPDVEELPCKILANKIAFGRRTHHGKELCATMNCTQIPKTDLVPCSPNLVQIHTNFVYYNNAVGVTIFHSMKHTDGKGGEDLLVDGFQIAETIRNNNPEIFKVLSTVKVNWSDYGLGRNENQKILQSPSICLDDKGNIVRINLSVPQRDSYFTIDIRDVKPWYQANKFFFDLCNDNAVKFKFRPGEMFVFDNMRVIHGRLPFEDTDNMELLATGTFIDWDEIYAKLRGLKHKLNI